MAGETLTMTRDQLTELVTATAASAATKAAEDTFKALNTVAPDARPPVASNVNRRRYGLPRLGVAMKALHNGHFRSSEAFELDVSQAAAEIFRYTGADTKQDDSDPVIKDFGNGSGYRSIIWPKTRSEFAEVLWQMGERKNATPMDSVDMAIRAMTEASTVSITANTAGGTQVPPQFLQDQFEYVLTSTIALRQVPGIEIMPVVSNIIYLPRESTAAGARTAAEAGTLTADDATFAQQQILIQKQYGYRLFSNELMNDANPSWMEFLSRSLVRDVALKQDLEFMEGTGSGSSIQGLVTYSGTTAGASLGTNGRTPTMDDFYDTQYNLRAVNSEPNFVITHPRTINSLGKLKDSTGNYILANRNGLNAPGSYGTGIPGAAPKAVLLDTLPVWFSTQINKGRTVGSSTDCTTVLVGTSDHILILERQGLEVAFSNQVAFNTDQTAARCIGRAAVAVTIPASLATITGVRP